jgi:hypothetical protein
MTKNQDENKKLLEHEKGPIFAQATSDWLWRFREGPPVPAAFDTVADFFDRLAAYIRCARASLVELARLPRVVHLLREDVDRAHNKLDAIEYPSRKRKART